jgi:hypothetical protein
MIYSLLQVGALMLTLEAAIFLARGSLVMDARTIAELSRITHRGYNAPLVRSLAKQTADSRVGVVLLLAAFLLQLTGQLHGPVMSDIGPADPTGIFIALVIGVAALAAACVSSRLCAIGIAREALGIFQMKTDEAAPDEKPRSERP